MKVIDTDKFLENMYAQLKKSSMEGYHQSSDAIIRVIRAAEDSSVEAFISYVIPKNNDTNKSNIKDLVDKIFLILVDDRQHNRKFSTGDTITYTPSEVRDIILKNIDKLKEH